MPLPFPGTFRHLTACCVRAVSAVIVTWLVLGRASVHAQVAAGDSQDLLVPGGIPSLAAILDLDPGMPRALFPIHVVRRLYDTPWGASESASRLLPRVRSHLERAEGQRDVPADRVPLPLGSNFWRAVVFRDAIEPGGLLRAILTDRNAALLYHGLLALDHDTLAFLAGRPALVREIHDRGAPAFATLARSLRVRDGTVRVPGGEPLRDAWESLAGTRPMTAARFTAALAAKDDGRLAFFFDTLAQLDAPRLRFATRGPDGEPSALTLQHLYRVFKEADPGWRVRYRPFARTAFDGATLLAAVKVTDDGRFAGPYGRRLWSAALSDDPETVGLGATAGGAAVDVVWLASRIARAIPDRRRELVETVSFAQRVLPETDGEEPEVLRALSGFRRFPMLALTLERIGIRSASLHARFVGVASQLADIDSAEAARQRLSLLQASLALVERLMFRGALQVATAEGLLSTLATRLEAGASPDPSVVGAWIAGDLLPQLGAAPPGDSPREALLLRALAGRPERSDDVQVEWEGTRYRVAANEMRFERLRNVRRRQENSLDAALDGVAAATPESGGQLAESLVSLAYAAALAESADWLPDARDLHLRHDYSSGTSGTDRSHPSWALGVEVSGPDVRWHIQGSLLGLDLVLAPLRLRRISSEPPHQAPRLNENDRRTFVQSLALLNPGRLTDADRDTLARSLARGRARVGTLVSRTADLAGAAADAGLSAWRFRAAEWTLQHEPDRLMDLWSMRELLALGDPNTRGRFDEWGLSAFPVDGSLRPRLCDPEPWEHIAGRPMTGRLAAFVPDLHLRMAETLAIRDLPASLAPAAPAGAVQSLIDEAQPAYMDDWQSLIAYVRNLPPARFDDYLSLLTAGGPLVPEAAADGASHEARTGSR